MTARSWLVLKSTAQTTRVEAGKHSIMRRTGLPGRGLQILDPFLSNPSTVLGRERAIMINLEHIKAIITTQEESVIDDTNCIIQTTSQHLLPRISQLLNQIEEGKAEENLKGWV
ncbi:hypothetical protein V6N13_124072 [Hibiscus sabdariffa]